MILSGAVGRAELLPFRDSDGSTVVGNRERRVEVLSSRASRGTGMTILAQPFRNSRPQHRP